MNMTLEIGYNHPVEVRNYAYAFDPLAGKRIVYISDCHYHLGSRKRVQRNIEQIRQLCPDLLLLGGDYIDTPLGLPNFQRFLDALDFVPRYVIAGNHDRPYIRRLRQMAENTGAVWLHNSTTNARLGDQYIRIDGTRPATGPSAAVSLHHESRGSSPTFAILCLHHPIDVCPFADQYDLIFAGHLHGSQIVLWETPTGLYPGRYIYRWNQLALDYGSCRYLISKGIGDTLPIRYRCPRDIIVVTFEHTTNLA